MTSLDVILLFFFFRTLFFFVHRRKAYPTKAPNTKKIHTNIQAAMAVIPSTFGEFVVMILKMFVRTRKRVMSKAILPGMTSGGMRKLTQETTTKRPEGR